jgi:hypothetical protein
MVSISGSRAIRGSSAFAARTMSRQALSTAGRICTALPR